MNPQSGRTGRVSGWYYDPSKDRLEFWRVGMVVDTITGPAQRFADGAWKALADLVERASEPVQEEAERQRVIRAHKVRPGMTRVIHDGNCVVQSVERTITEDSDVVDIRFVDGGNSSSETMAAWVKVPVLAPVPTGEGTGE